MKKKSLLLLLPFLSIMAITLFASNGKMEVNGAEAGANLKARAITNNVNGGSATVTKYEQPSYTVTAASQGWTDLGVTYYDPNTGEMKKYGGSKITIEFAGEKYTAYCLDPQLGLPTGELVCNPINYNPQINAFMNEIGSTSGSEQEIQENQLMFRIWAAIEGWTMGDVEASDDVIYDENGNEIPADQLGGSFGKEQKEFKNTVKRYYEIYKDEINYKKYAYLCGDTTPCSSKEEVLAKLIGDTDGSFARTFKKAVEVIENNEGYEKVSTEDIQGQVKAHIVSENKNEIIYEFKSYTNIDGKEEVVNIPTLTVKCVEGCTESVMTEWNGTYGKYKISLNDGSCEYKINLYYDTKGAYECSTNDSNTQTLYTYIDKTSTQAVQQIKGIAPGCTGECCEEAPAIDPEFKHVDVNNCCSPTTSTVEEYKLNELFCYDKELKVEHYDAKCNAEAFMEEINQFCQMYCTERVSVDLPGAITATSGRYFTLTKNPVGNTTSAFIRGAKRCRVLTDMERWFGEYNAQVNQQVKYFNLYQQYAATKKVIENIMATQKTNQYNSVAYKCTSSGLTCGDISGTQNLDTTYPITSYFYVPEDYDKGKKYDGDNKYYQAKIKEQLNKEGEYSNLELELNKTPKTLNKLTQYSATEATSLTFYLTGRYVNQTELDAYKTAVENAILDAQSDVNASLPSNSKCSYTCKPVGTIEEEKAVSYNNGEIVLTKGIQDFEQYLDNATSDIQRLKELYNAAAKTATKYEGDLNQCHNYFNPELDVEAFYKFNPKQKFSYTQTYLNESGKLVSDRIYVDFEKTPGCKYEIIDAAVSGGDDEISKPAYSEIFYEKDFTTKDMVENESLPWLKNPSEFESLIDKEYKGDKAVRNDGKVLVTCEWDEGENRVYTLAQSGAIQKEATSLINYTVHEREYQVYLSTLEGTYETFWEISGLGTNGKFDKYFNEAGKSCAGEDPKKVGMFTCKLAVEHEVVLTGYCNGNAQGVQNGISNCVPFKEGYELVNFKVVEPSDLFPSTNDPDEIPSHQGETYAHNWVEDKEGKEVLRLIQETGAKDETYSPKNLSYSFTISPNDMRQIKEYNEEKLGDGGYTDFNLKCECPTEVNSKDSCVKCRSEFVENLANGKIKLENGTVNATGWSNERESLGSIRGSNNW